MNNYLSRRNNDVDFFNFDDFFRPFDNAYAMRTDVREENGNYLLDVDLPGFDKKDISLSLDDGYLTVSAHTDESKQEKGKDNYIRRERRFGSCSRSFYVGDIEEKDVQASYNNGILSISFPKDGKHEKAKKQIEIR